MTSNHKRLFSVVALSVIILGGGYAVGSYLYRSFHQASIRTGEVFPDLWVRKTDASGEVVQIPTKKPRIVMIVRNGCQFCDSLERRLTMVIRPQDIINLYILSLDDAPSTAQHQALAKFRYVYDGKQNDLFFNQTPQIYVIDSKNIVRKKYLGALDTAQIHELFQQFRKSPQ